MFSKGFCLVPFILLSLLVTDWCSLLHAQQANPPLQEKGTGVSPLTVFDRIEQEEMIFQLTLGRLTLNEGIIGYSGRDGVFLPLDEVSRTLEFAISVDPSLGQAEGWFLSEAQGFFLNVPSGKAILEGHAMPFDLDMVLVGEEDIFVNTLLLAKWFPIDFEVDLSQLIVRISTREPLPFEARLEREERRQRLKVGRSSFPDFSDLSTPYGWIGWPAFDLGYNSTYLSEQDSIDGQYSMVMSQDLFKMNSTMFMTGTHEEAVTGARLTLGRRSIQKNILGPLRMSELLMGDVFNPQLPLISDSRAGAGVLLSNFPLFQQSEFDRTSLRGELPQGWEVELYRNEILIDSQASRGDGRYEFVDVPLVFGSNVLRLIFYGPQAQKREKVQTIAVGQGLPQSGQHFFRLAGNLDDTDLYDFIDKDYQREDPIADLSRYFGEYQFGIAKRVSLGAALASLPVDGARRTYGSVEMRGSLLGTFSRIHFSQDFSGGQALQLATQTWVAGTNLFVKHSEYRRYLSEQNFNAADPLLRESSLRLNSLIPSVWGIPQIPLTISANYDHSTSGKKTLDLFNRISFFSLGFSASHSIDWVFDIGAGQQSAHRGSGSFLLNGRFYRLSLRGSFDYGISPDPEASRVSFTGDYYLSRRFSVRAAVEHELNPSDRTTLTSGINYQNTYFGLGLFGRSDSEGVFSINAGLTFSFGWNAVRHEPILRSDRLASTGGALARVFLDHNQNGQYDGNDEPISGVHFSPGGRESQTDEDGYLYISGLSPNLSTPVAVDERSLEDPYWILTPKGYDVLSRPGLTSFLNFPVVTTGEIDGTIYLVDRDATKAVSNVLIQLVDSTGTVLQEVKSAYDGFYLFARVSPGAYSVRISPEQAERLQLLSPQIEPVTIAGEDNIISGVDVLLQKLE